MHAETPLILKISQKIYLAVYNPSVYSPLNCIIFDCMTTVHYKSAKGVNVPQHQMHLIFEQYS